MDNQPKAVGLTRHTLLMLACCLIPLALIAAVSVFRVDLGSIGYVALLLLCPLMHLFMMRGMHNHSASDKHVHGDGQSCHADDQVVGAGSAGRRDERAKVPATLER